MKMVRFMTSMFKNIFGVSESDKMESEFKRRFSYYFFKDKYYLHKNSSEHELASILNVSEAYLCNFMMVNYQMNFFAMCNKHRIEHFKAAMEKPCNFSIPISSLIKGSGFGSFEEFKAALQANKFF
jgi:AraC-like DNA-binding protein